MSRTEADLSFVAGGSDMFAGTGPTRSALRALDWAATPLGAAPEWAADLRGAVRVVAAAAAPMALWWGNAFHQFHNDALLTVFGDDEPSVGRPAESSWPARWAVLGPAVRAVRADGGLVHLDDVELPAASGDPLQVLVWLSPLGGQDGRPDGVLATIVDLTARVSAAALERRTADETKANLQIALLTNRRIGTAIAILMDQRRITDDAAFELLRAASQRQHRKLRDIAEDVVLTGALPVG